MKTSYTGSGRTWTGVTSPGVSQCVGDGGTWYFGHSESPGAPDAVLQALHLRGNDLDVQVATGSSAADPKSAVFRIPVGRRCHGESVRAEDRLSTRPLLYRGNAPDELLAAVGQVNANTFSVER